MEIEFVVRGNAYINKSDLDLEDKWTEFIDDKVIKEYVNDNVSLDFDNARGLEYYIEDAYEM